jgi:hypothetical protein
MPRTANGAWPDSGNNQLGRDSSTQPQSPLNRPLKNLSAAMLSASLLAASADDLRVGFGGLTWSAGDTGAPFLWEVLLLVYFAATATLVALNGIPPVPPLSTYLLTGVTLIMVPVFANAILYSSDLYGLLKGSGQARLLLYPFAITGAVTACPLEPSKLRMVIIAVVAAAIANSVVSIAWSVNLIDTPGYWVSHREGDLRASGLFGYPARMGVLAALGITLSLGLQVSRLIRTLLVAVLVYALAQSDSRSGFVGASVGVFGFAVVRLLTPGGPRAISLAVCGAASLLVVAAEWKHISLQDVERLSAYVHTVGVFFDHPLGLPLGEWEQFSDVVPPHSSVLFYLVYGGISTGAGLIILGAAVLALFVCPASREQVSVGCAVMPAVLGVLAASMFEQIPLQISTMLPFVVLLFGYARLNSSAASIGLRTQQHNPSTQAFPYGSVS